MGFSRFLAENCVNLGVNGMVTVMIETELLVNSGMRDVEEAENREMLNAEDFLTSQRGRQEAQKSPFYFPSQRKLFSQSGKKFFPVRE